MKKFIQSILCGTFFMCWTSFAFASSTFNVQISDNRFSPSTLHIHTGDTINWDNRDAITHSISGFGIVRTLNSGEGYNYTFSAPGTYDYKCTMHDGMVGKIVVTDIEDDLISAEPVTADNVVDTLFNSLDEGIAQSAETLVESAATGALADLKDANQRDLVSGVNKITDEAKVKISALSSKGGENFTDEKIQALKDFVVRIRAYAIARNHADPSDMLIMKNTAKLFKVRWGNLDAKRQRCTGISLSELRDSLSKNEVPAACENGNRISYSGTIGVNKGSLEIQNRLFFETQDKITDPSGTSVSFTSDIYNDSDGIMLLYIPEKNDNGEPLLMSIKIGTLDKTFSGDQIIGIHDIGSGQFMEVKHLAGFVPGLAKDDQDKLTKSHLDIQNVISVFLNKLDKIRILKQVGESADVLEKLMYETGDYNFDIISGGRVENAISRAADDLSLDTASSDLDLLSDDLIGKISSFKADSKSAKYDNKIIPFKDTDDDQWFADYVADVKSKGVISGYKDGSGAEIGEFRPANNITVAEMLKIALGTSGKGASESDPALQSAQSHWAKGYVSEAEKLGLSIIKGDLDLDRPATRAEVIRTMLEVFGIKPDDVKKTDFSDVIADGSGDAPFIQYGKILGIISGDAGKTTFRPNEPINRAEVAKISSRIIAILMGGM